jgi:hypothetical protein
LPGIFCSPVAFFSIPPYSEVELEGHTVDMNTGSDDCRGRPSQPVVAA